MKLVITFRKMERQKFDISKIGRIIFFSKETVYDKFE